MKQLLRKNSAGCWGCSYWGADWKDWNCFGPGMVVRAEDMKEDEWWYHKGWFFRSVVASCVITCRSILFLRQIGKCFLWVKSCWLHQENLILRTYSQGTCSHIYTRSYGSCWGKLVTAQFKKKPYRQNAEEAEEPPAFFFSPFLQANPIWTTVWNWKKKKNTKKRGQKGVTVLLSKVFLQFLLPCGDR